MGNKPITEGSYSRLTMRPAMQSATATLFDRMLPALSSLVGDSRRDPTPDEYEFTITPGMTANPTETQKAKRFMDYMAILVGEDDLAIFTETPNRIAYRITPVFVSIAITGLTSKPRETAVSKTLVYNFSMTSLNKNAALN